MLRDLQLSSLYLKILKAMLKKKLKTEIQKNNIEFSLLQKKQGVGLVLHNGRLSKERTLEAISLFIFSEEGALQARAVVFLLGQFLPQKKIFFGQQ